MRRGRRKLQGIQYPEHKMIGAWPRQGWVRVIRLPSDGSLDYQIPYSRAKELYEQGKMAFDLTNGCYTTYTDWKHKSAGPQLL